MINRYLAPCRHCGGTVPADSGTVEKVVFRLLKHQQH